MSVFRPNLFKNCVAVVTGGGSGIGRAISYELLSLGCKVIIASRNFEKLQRTADELSKIGEITPMICNIRHEDQVNNLISETLKKFGKLDFLVNNGGGQFMSPVADMTLKGWNAVIETNLTGTFLMCREAYNQWFKDNGGSIVNLIADIWRGFPQMGHSSAARAGNYNLTKTMAVEWASSGVRVNAVAPGLVSSKSAAANYNTNVFEIVKPYLPAKRTGYPDEISGAVAFLLSPAASYISGTVIKVDCGSSLYSQLMWSIEEHDKLRPHKWIPDSINESTENSKS